LLPIEDMHLDLNYGPLSEVPVYPPDPNGAYPGAIGWYYKNGEPFRYESEEDRDPMPDEITADFALDVLSRDLKNHSSWRWVWYAPILHFMRPGSISTDFRWKKSHFPHTWRMTLKIAPRLFKTTGSGDISNLML